MKRNITLALIASASIFLTACSIPGISKQPTAVKDSSPTNETAKANVEEKSSELSFEGNVFDLLKNVTAGSALKCTFETTTEGTNIKGTTYVKDKVIRSDVELSGKEAMNIKSSSIIKEEWVYTWMTDKKQGVKISMNSVMKDGEIDKDALTQEGIKDAFQAQDNMNYKCSQWTADNKMFEVPSDINFVDLSAMMDAFKNMDPSKLKLPIDIPGNE